MFAWTSWTPLGLKPTLFSDSGRRRRALQSEGTAARTEKELQLQRAKHLLETTLTSVKEIVAAVGLSEVPHFVRDFEKEYGLSPARYADRHHRRILTKVTPWERPTRPCNPIHNLNGCPLAPRKILNV